MLEFIIYFLVIYILFFFIYYVICMGRLAADKIFKIAEVTFLVKYYKIDLNDVNKSKLFACISAVDGFIISLTSSIAFNISNILLMVILCSLIMLACLYLGYVIIFRILVNKKVFMKKRKKDNAK